MTTAVLSRPGRPRSLIGKVAAVLSARARARGKPSRAAALLRDHVLTVAAMAAVDTGMFHLGLVTGCVALGVSLLVLDFKLDD